MYEEQPLKEQFVAFLKNKGYSEDSILYDASFQDTITRVASKGFMTVDLAILDKQINEILAVVEFKENIKLGDDAHERFVRMANAIRHDTKNDFVSFFVVIPDSENDFRILVLSSQNTFLKIRKEQFPSLQELIDKRNDQILGEKFETVREKLKTINEVKRKTLTTTAVTFASLIFGIIVSMVASTFLNKNERESMQALKYQSQSDSMQNELVRIKQQMYLLLRDSSQNIDSIPARIHELAPQAENRLRILESAVLETPEKVLAISRLNNQIDQLRLSLDHAKELQSSKIDMLNQKINDANSMIIGLFVAMFSAVVGYFITNVRKAP